MSSQQGQNKNSGSGFLKTAAAFAGGAIAGAVLAWVASEVVDEINQPHQNTSSRTSTSDAEKEEKADGIIQLCEICFLPFEEIKKLGGQIMATPCGHVFCRKCILQSLSLRADCPNCRQPMEASDLQRLYL